MDKGRIVLSGTPDIEVQLRRSRVARRMTLRVSRLDGRVTLTLPATVPEREAQSFLRDRESWLRGHVSSVADGVDVTHGAIIPIEGQDTLIQPGTGGSVAQFGATLRVPGPVERLGARVRSYLKILAQDRLLAASDEYAAALGRPYNRLTLRDTRSRWGSCSAQGNLMYSWRLIMTPPEVLRYVAAHEVAHLVEMNHSATYWKTVARICPDYQRHRNWLRINGTDLHRYRFDA